MLSRLLTFQSCAELRLSCMRIYGSSSLALRGLASEAQTQQSPVTSDPSEPSTSGRGRIGEVKPDLVEKFLGTANMNHKQKAKVARQDLIKRLQRHGSDVGSPQVTVAIWTHQIREQTKQFYLRPKNPIVMRQFEIIMHKRRRLLAYLRDANFSAYASCIQQLGLADVFGRGMSADRYPVGIAHGDPAGASDAVRRRRFAFHSKYKLKKTSQWKRLLPQLEAQDPSLPKPPAAMISGSVQRLEEE